MKKTVSLLLVMLMILPLYACGGKSRTFDDICTMSTSDNEYTINSIDGETFILYSGRKSQYVPGVGTVYYSSEKTTYSYTLKENNIIVVDKIEYTYTFDSKNESITFTPSFLSIASEFNCTLN